MNLTSNEQSVIKALTSFGRLTLPELIVRFGAKPDSIQFLLSQNVIQEVPARVGEPFLKINDRFLAPNWF